MSEQEIKPLESSTEEVSSNEAAPSIHRPALKRTPLTGNERVARYREREKKKKQAKAYRSGRTASGTVFTLARKSYRKILRIVTESGQTFSRSSIPRRCPRSTRNVRRSSGSIPRVSKKISS